MRRQNMSILGPRQVYKYRKYGKSLIDLYQCVALYRPRFIQPRCMYLRNELLCQVRLSYAGVNENITLTNATTDGHKFVNLPSLENDSGNFISAQNCDIDSVMENTYCQVTIAENVSHVSYTDATVTEDSGKRKSDETDETDKNNRKKRRGGGGKKLPPGERYVPPPQKRNPGVSFGEEHFEETSYYFEGGLRKVYSYYFDYKTYCKGRWVGKSLLEVFSSEFRAEPLEYYKQAVKEGRIRLNEVAVDDLNITLKNNDFMRNTVHRHEPPVCGKPLKILEVNDDVVVVDKPASLPVHPCGRFRHNTVIFILGKEKGLSGLHTVHRLDRLTSGVLMFARTLEVSKKLDQLVRERQLEKEYVCRVEGEFPESELICEEPIMVMSFKVGLCRVDPKGKPCRTVFQRLSWNGTSSVVRCLPLTGRTHQIRVHLQFLGFPILNDPIYGSSAWGPKRAKGGLVGMNDEEILESLLEDHRSKESLHMLDIAEDGIKQKSEEQAKSSSAAQRKDELLVTSEMNSSCEDRITSDGPETRASQLCGLDSDGPRTTIQERVTGTESDAQLKTAACDPADVTSKQFNCVDSASEEDNCAQKETADASEETPFPAKANRTVKDHLCRECKIVRPDPTDQELIMYLHALRYKGPDFEYSTNMPDWAEENWVEDRKGRAEEPAC